MKKEIWRDITGYEGRYQISDFGRVKSLERTFIDRAGHKRHTKERILKLCTDRYGYLYVLLYYGSGMRKRFLVHRLVCEAFHDNSENKPCVNHIDENKTNNTANNLEWCTVAENNRHGTLYARSAKTLSKPVGQYTLDGKLIKVWQSAHEVQRQLGFTPSSICEVARGKRKTAYGYIWKYIEEEK